MSEVNVVQLQGQRNQELSCKGGQQDHDLLCSQRNHKHCGNLVPTKFDPTELSLLDMCSVNVKLKLHQRSNFCLLCIQIIDLKCKRYAQKFWWKHFYLKVNGSMWMSSIIAKLSCLKLSVPPFLSPSMAAILFHVCLRVKFFSVSNLDGQVLGYDVLCFK